MQHPPPNNYVPQPSFSTNYMQQPLPKPKDISDPTTAMNMSLVLMAKAFKLTYSTPTNNNQRISSNPYNRQIAQPSLNMGQDRQMQMVRGNHVGQNAVQNLGIQNVRNQNGLIVVSGIANQNANQNGNGNVVVARAEGDIDEIEEVNANCILMANLQQVSTSITQTDKALVYDSDGLAKDDSNVIPVDCSMIPSGGELEQHPATIEETRALFESLFNNLVIEVEKLNTVNRKMKETNADLTTKLARYKGQENAKSREELYFSNTSKTASVSNTISKPILIPDDGFLDNSSSSSVARKFLKVHKILKDEIAPIVNQVDTRVINFEKQFLKEAAKFIQGFKSLAKEADESLDMNKLAIRNDKSKAVCALCKQCLIIANHDVCVFNYVNDMNSRADNQNDNVLNVANQKKHKAKVKKSKKLVIPSVNLPFPKVILLVLLTIRNLEANSFLVLLLFLKFMGTVRLGNDHIAFYDSDLEVAFKRNTCFFKNLEGVDMLKGNRTTNLYTINLCEMAFASLICLMARATSTKSWLWHQRKSKQSPRKPKPVPSLNQMLHLFHMDLFGPMRVESSNGKRALCYPKNDSKDIGKLGTKGNIGFFIGYSATSYPCRV
ncbi:hypothetical protein Tco_1065057 [Tanacetum coccineum]